MEYVPSIKINDIQKLKENKFNTEKIATKLLECFIDQIIKYGNVHIDPHPGNLGITTSGKIVFYDYGMVLQLDNAVQKNFDNLLIALYDKNIDSIADIIVEIGLVVIEKKDMPYLKKFLIFFLSYIEKVDINEFKVSYLDTDTKSELPFVISSKFLLLLRGVSILEGNCKLLDPNFNYKKVIDPYINGYLTDIRYIENKAIYDFDTIRVMPTKMKEQQIDMEILNINAKSKDVSLADIKKKKAAFISIITLFTIMTNQGITDDTILATIFATILLL
jgi:predicted unusual protein kinase regulating ubiquinone biosynthesis (AarF/ABC1/UbiB family)